jgi:hypothetical protein
MLVQVPVRAPVLVMITDPSLTANIPFGEAYIATLDEAVGQCCCGHYGRSHTTFVEKCDEFGFVLPVYGT